MRAVTYRRASTREQGDSGLGLEAQTAALEAAIAAKGWTHVQDFHDVSTGKTTNRRDGLASAIEMVESGKADVLVVSKLDRLSRSVSDFANLLDRARRNGWAIKLLDPDIDLTTATGELVSGILSQVVQWEGRIIGERTTAALQEARKRGTPLGRPVAMDKKVRSQILRLRREGMSLQAIAGQLNERGVPTTRGGLRWYPSTVNGVIRSEGLVAEKPRAKGGTKESPPPSSRKGFKPIPGSDKFRREAQFDVGERVQYEGGEFLVGGLAKGSEGFTYMLRREGSRRQYFVREVDLEACTGTRARCEVNP